MAKRVSIKDIANKVGVSTALVSYVLNGLEKEKRIGPEVVKKIHEAVKELNYQPNQIARSLRKGSTSTIGLIVADISNPFFGQLARVVENEAAQFGYAVVFGSSDENAANSAILIKTLVNRQIDGLILAPPEGSAEQIKYLMNQGIPFVLVDRYLPDISTNRVVLDNYNATYSAVKCFVANGYRRITLVTYKSTLVHMRERIRGYQEGMKDNGLSDFIVVKEVRYNQIKEDMEAIMTGLLNERGMDAVLFATNALSISGLYAIRKSEVKVPEELAVIGFDGHEVFDFFQPPLSYIQQPLEEMGKESVRVLIDQIRGSQKTVHIEMRHQLITRKSCG